MALLKGVGGFFALDIGTSAVRVVQLNSNGKNWSLGAYGYARLDLKTSAASSAESNRKLGEVIITAIGQSGISSKDVVIGLASDKTFTTIIEVPNMPKEELASTMRYQMEQYVPIPINEAKTDWVSLGTSMRNPQMQEVLLASTAKEYTESRLEFVESLGFNVIAAEPEPIAMIRSLLPPNVTDARVLVDVGENSTNIAVTHQDTPRLVRSLPMGLSTLVKAAVQNLNVDENQARQFILKFGLAPDRLDGQVLRALEPTLGNFVTEIDKSVKFFQTRYADFPLSIVMLSGYAAAIPRFNDFIAAKAKVTVEVANPWQRVSIAQQQQEKLLPVAAEFATVVGLAMRSTK
jgi:type IV pilus assembly protein PilM